MKVLFIDYAEAYYSGAAGMPERRSGKFVQIRNGPVEYLVFSPKELTPYHAGIVERFCREKGLTGSYDAKSKRFDIEEPGWAVAGGGKFELDGKEKVIRFYDDSMAYGRFDPKGLKDKIRSIGRFSAYTVQIA